MDLRFPIFLRSPFLGMGTMVALRQSSGNTEFTIHKFSRFVKYSGIASKQSFRSPTIDSLGLRIYKCQSP